MTVLQIAFEGGNNPQSPERPVDQNAQGFFAQSLLSDLIQKIWQSLKNLKISDAIKLVKIVAVVVAVALLYHNISLIGIIALAGSVVSLIIAAITNVIVWMIYIPTMILNSDQGLKDITLAALLAWLFGINPLTALVLSPVMMLGLRLLENSQLAQKNISEFINQIGKLVGKLPKLNDLAKLPDFPNIPNLPKLPDFPVVVPAFLHAIPGGIAVQKAKQVRPVKFPNMPSLPKMPAMPEVNLPTMPKLPTKPKLKLPHKPKFAQKMQRGRKG